MQINIFLASIPIILGFIFFTSIAFFINPQIPTDFFSNKSAKLFYDVQHYSDLALYPSCTAFYPLWSWLISNIGKPQTANDAAFYFRIIGSLISLATVPLFILTLKQHLKSYKILFLSVALYAVNPLSVFRMIGYTESIFSFLSLLLILSLGKLKEVSRISSKFVLIAISVFALTFLLSLTRPFLIQIVFASILALVSVLSIESFKSNSEVKKYFKLYGAITFLICLGAFAGYCIYGYYCLKTRGDFFAPFYDQRIWGKKLGIYPHLFFIPLTSAEFIAVHLPVIAVIISWTICISVHIKKLTFINPKVWQWILLFFYPPAFLAFYGIDFKKANCSDKSTNLKEISLTQSSNHLSRSYVFWLCLYFVLMHSVIIVFSDQKLTSLRRFVFSTPYLFFAIACISSCFPTRKVSKLLLLIIAVSCLWLVQYWLDYGNGIWIG